MDYEERLRKLEQRIAKLERLAALPTPPAQMVVWDKEYERILRLMREIQETYAGHQTWANDDRERYKELRSRRNELRKLLRLKE